MIVPTKGVTPDRALITVGAQILATLDRPLSVSQAWSKVQDRRKDEGLHAPLPFWWFTLALDTLYALGTIEFKESLLQKTESPFRAGGS